LDIKLNRSLVTAANAVSIANVANVWGGEISRAPPFTALSCNTRVVNYNARVVIFCGGRPLHLCEMNQIGLWTLCSGRYNRKQTSSCFLTGCAKN